MSAGWAHCLARSADGRVFSWGDNEFGQLGHMSAAPIAMPSEVDFGVATDFDGRVGDVASSSQSRFSCAVSTEGRAYLWGKYGSLNIVSRPGRCQRSALRR